jgi:hypothetical protein
MMADANIAAPILLDVIELMALLRNAAARRWHASIPLARDPLIVNVGMVRVAQQTSSGTVFVSVFHV